MSRFRLITVLCCVWSIFFGQLSPAVAAKNKAEIVGAQVTRENGNLLVDFHIENCFTPEMKEALQTGVPATFRVRVVVEEQGVPFLRDKLLDVVLERTIEYDLLTNDYRVELPEDSETLRVTKDFGEAKQWMSTVRQLPVIPLWRLQKSHSYQLRLKAALSKHQMPFFLKYIFFFVTLWDFESDWQKVAFNP